MRKLTARGHRAIFLERDQPWYRDNRDLPRLPYGNTEIYSDLDELTGRFADAVREADLVVVGSYVPEGVAVGEWMTGLAKGMKAFYDMDTPVTLAKLEQCGVEYLSYDLIPHYDLYLSFAGGPTLRRIEQDYGAPMVRPFYCSVAAAIT